MIGAEDTETGALVISVTRRELVKLVRMIREVEAVRLDVEPSSTEPRLRGIARIYLEGGGDRMAVRVKDGDAWMTGNRAGREILARGLEVFAEYNDLDEPGMHAHFDPEEPGIEDPVLARGSVPLIVTGPVPDVPRDKRR